MSDHSEEHAAATQNQQIIERLRTTFRASELRLTPEVEPATLFSPAPIQEEVE